MRPYGLLTDDELRGYLGLSESLGQQSEDFQLSLRQSGLDCARHGRARALNQPPYARKELIRRKGLRNVIIAPE